MRLARLLGPELRQTLAHDPDQLQEALKDFHVEDLAELLEDLPAGEAASLFGAVPKEMAAEVLAHMDLVERAEILRSLEVPEAADLLVAMAADDRADTIQDLPSPIAEEILAHIERAEPELAEDTRELVSYPEDTAGGLMTTEFVALPPHCKVWQAIDAVREHGQRGKVETIYYTYVVAFGGRLVGVVSLRDLILADPGVAIAEVMTENVVRVTPEADQEEVAATTARYNLTAVPVIDDHGRMLGLVTVDDVFDVVVEEATEDAQLVGAVAPIDDAYFDTDFWTFIRKRAPWLIVLFVGGLLTAAVMENYQRDLSMLADLVVFIPLIISSGGNSGSQSSSLIIRALAIGEVEPADWWRVFVRELSIGVCLGAILGTVGFARAALFQEHDPVRMGVAVASSIVIVVIMGTLVGSLIPLGLRRMRIDPAVSSTPFIASLVDVLGLLVYLSMARVVFAQVLGN